MARDVVIGVKRLQLYLRNVAQNQIPFATSLTLNELGASRFFFRLRVRNAAVVELCAEPIAFLTGKDLRDPRTSKGGGSWCRHV